MPMFGLVEELPFMEKLCPMEALEWMVLMIHWFKVLKALILADQKPAVLLHKSNLVSGVTEDRQICGIFRYRLLILIV